MTHHGVDREALERAERAVRDDALLEHEPYWSNSEDGPLEEDFDGINSQFDDITLEEMRRRRSCWAAPLAALVAFALVVTWVLSRW